MEASDIPGCALTFVSFVSESLVERKTLIGQQLEEQVGVCERT